MRRMLAVLAFTIGCKASGASAQEGGDIAVPKMPPDAATNTSGSSTSAPPRTRSRSSKRAAAITLAPRDGQSSPSTEASALAPSSATPRGSGPRARRDRRARRGVLERRRDARPPEDRSRSRALRRAWRDLRTRSHRRAIAVVAFEKLAAPESIEKKTFCVPARTIVARAKVVLVVARADGERLIADSRSDDSLAACSTRSFSLFSFSPFVTRSEVAPATATSYRDTGSAVGGASHRGERGSPRIPRHDVKMPLQDGKTLALSSLKARTSSSLPPKGRETSGLHGRALNFRDKFEDVEKSDIAVIGVSMANCQRWAFIEKEKLRSTPRASTMMDDRRRSGSPEGPSMRDGPPRREGWK